MQLSTIYGSIAILSLISAAGALDTEMHVYAIILIISFTVFSYLAMKEEGYIRKKRKKNVLPPENNVGQD